MEWIWPVIIRRVLFVDTHRLAARMSSTVPEFVVRLLCMHLAMDDWRLAAGDRRLVHGDLRKQTCPRVTANSYAAEWDQIQRMSRDGAHIKLCDRWPQISVSSSRATSSCEWKSNLPIDIECEIGTQIDLSARSAL